MPSSAQAPEPASSRAAGTPAEVFESPLMERIFGILPDLRHLDAQAADAEKEEHAWN